MKRPEVMISVFFATLSLSLYCGQFRTDEARLEIQRDGVGPIRIGRTFAEISADIRALPRWQVELIPADRGYTFYKFKLDGIPAVTAGDKSDPYPSAKVAWIEIEHPSLRTKDGIRPGSPLKEVLRLFPGIRLHRTGCILNGGIGECFYPGPYQTTGAQTIGFSLIVRTDFPLEAGRNYTQLTPGGSASTADFDPEAVIGWIFISG